ncbi:MAG: DUF2683 family protein [Nanoarchaeota archaeon]|nr:DUF2683 family protein [Nanoarchaeota archaeon]
MTTSLRMEVDEYTNRVLGVIKEKFGLGNKSQALDKFADIYGDDFVEKEVKEEYIEEVLAIIRDHKKKHNKRKMTLKELDKLSGV